MSLDCICFMSEVYIFDNRDKNKFVMEHGILFFRRGPTDHKRSVGPLLSLPEVHDQLFGFAHVQRETVECEVEL